MERFDVLFVGLGGGGVLLAGELLARTATSQYEHVTWYPYYGAQQRGGPSQCFVIFSDREIASPYVSRPQAVIALEQSQFRPFEKWVIPGGLMVTESFELKDEPERDDIRLIKCSGIEIAMKLGDRRASNFCLLGAYVGMSHCVSPGLVEQEIEKKFGNSKASSLNKNAFSKGLELASES